MSRHFRQQGEGEEQLATNLELFFDLVFVFAVTQLSGLLVSHLTVTGAVETLFLLLVVWWAWVYTTWMTNWYDPDSTLVRLVLIGVMLLSLLMAIAIPEAFGDQALLFAAGYAGLQIGRNLFVARTTRPDTPLADTFHRILLWSVATGVLWVAGGLMGGERPEQALIWTAALALDYAGPAAGYWLPGRGRAAATDWEIEPTHFAERFQLFIIIALGESIVVTGLTASRLDVDPARTAAIAIAFLQAAALWWLYFDYVASIAQVRLDHSGRQRGALARDAYTYGHLPMVAGIIAAAVGAELVIAHPGATLHRPELAALAGGPALYLLGHVEFRLRMAGSLSGKRLGAAVAVLVCGVVGLAVPALACAILILLVLVVLIAAETASGARRRRRGEPSPIDRVRQEG
jgi:low temperature requirement protein LtrA